jgi:hypothetical protein
MSSDGMVRVLVRRATILAAFETRKVLMEIHSDELVSHIIICEMSLSIRERGAILRFLSSNPQPVN